jgi:hypothetical protein
MSGGNLDEFGRRVKYSFYGTLVFLLVVNPITIGFMQSIFRGIVNIVQDGRLTTPGYLIQSLMFFLITLGVMMIPRV